MRQAAISNFKFQIVGNRNALIFKSSNFQIDNLKLETRNQKPETRNFLKWESFSEKRKWANRQRR